jgi:CRP-like cAMP-binding protein
MSTGQSNHLIQLLGRADRKRLLAIAEPFDLVLSQVLYQPGSAVRHVYFPQSGFISLVTLLDDREGMGVEVGMAGVEGMLGSHVALGVKETPLHALVQGAGTAWRIESVAFASELARSASLQRVMNRYLYVLMLQMGAAAACLRFHLIGPRLARWMLMSHDRAQADELHMTHEFLAYMLGVRRVGITAAAGELQRSGAISYHRGVCRVLDRERLEAAACSCYDADRRHFLRLLG